MDGSFLSRPEVIAASRQFVCVRLATYEDAGEGTFLKSFGASRSGELENTVFTILAPDGRRELARATRSAARTFDDARQMAESMQRIAAAYAARPADGPPPLPAVATVRLAVNVAACDGRPLVVVSAADAAQRRQMEERLRPLAWGERFLGRFVYASATAADELVLIDGAAPGVLVVQPDRFGRKGSVLARAGVEASADALAACLADGLAKYRPTATDFGTHVRDGRQLRVLWDTAIPVTDPLERRARERGRSPE